MVRSKHAKEEMKKRQQSAISKNKKLAVHSLRLTNNNNSNGEKERERKVRKKFICIARLGYIHFFQLFLLTSFLLSTRFVTVVH